MLEILAGHMMWGRPSAVTMWSFIMWAASIFSFCLRMYFLLLLHRVFFAFGPYCIFCRVFYQLPCKGSCSNYAAARPQTLGI